MMKACICLRHRRFLFVLCSLSLLCFLAPASAPGEQKTTSERAKAIIDGKGLDVVCLSVHGFKNLKSNRLDVPYNPMIYDIDGTALTLQDLKVPCEAYVEYRAVGENAPQLFRLEVVRYSAEANSLFTEKKKPAKLPE